MGLFQGVGILRRFVRIGGGRIAAKPSRADERGVGEVVARDMISVFGLVVLRNTHTCTYTNIREDILTAMKADESFSKTIMARFGK